MSDDPHKPLREDVKLLGELLGQTLREQEGKELYTLVEEVRALAKEARGGNMEVFSTLHELLAKLPVENATSIAKAFASFLHLANIAEQHHRIRRYRHYRLEHSEDPQRGSCEEVFASLLKSGIDKEDLYKAICDLQIELVLTAHPTEVARRTLLLKYNKIAAALKKRDRADLTPIEKEKIMETLHREIVACWNTDEIRRVKPTPLEEARGGLTVIEQTLWNVMPQFIRELDRVLQKSVGKSLPLTATPICISSWMGGDRDGNPNVTPDVTYRVYLVSRWMGASLYLKEIELLYGELSMHKCNDKMRLTVGEAYEPYRHLLRKVRQRLRDTCRYLEDVLARKKPPALQVYETVKQLQEPLLLCYESLCETGAKTVADGRLLDILRRLSCFGLALIKLDIRQESDRHSETLDAITQYLGMGSYLDWNEDKRQEFLIKELQSKRPLIPKDFPANKQVSDVLETFAIAAKISPDFLGAYVISMATSPSDVLAVELLQKEAGITKTMRVVPLFETVDDLRVAESTMRRLLAIDWYKSHINGYQEIMIGYSDSAKSSGKLSAAWELFKAQEKIVAACREHGVQTTLFHGRGGTVGRGGGPTYLAILSQPPGSIDRKLRVTEQGEMIQNKFGIPGIAFRSLEVYVTATLKATLAAQETAQEKWRQTMDEMANQAREAYCKILAEPNFIAYFRSATPEVELSNLNIGSRPTRRKRDGGLESLRAIPWIFSWTQTRLLLPSWLGVGEALSKAAASGKIEVLQEMYQNWPFFRSTIDLIEMVLAKADMKIAAQYDKNLVAKEHHELGEKLRSNFQKTVDIVLKITGHKKLLDNNEVLRRSIDVRNPYVDPINLLQVEILRRLRDEKENVELQNALLTTINGIAAGMRNTG